MEVTPSLLHLLNIPQMDPRVVHVTHCSQVPSISQDSTVAQYGDMFKENVSASIIASSPRELQCLTPVATPLQSQALHETTNLTPLPPVDTLPTSNEFTSPLSNQDDLFSKRGRPRAEVVSSLIRKGFSSPCEIKCKICSRVFPREKSLQAHLRTHTGEKPYICDYPDCGRGFTQSGQLKTHQRLHAGEKPFVCSAPKCENRYTHANRTCPLHPEFKPHRSDVPVPSFVDVTNLVAPQVTSRDELTVESTTKRDRIVAWLHRYHRSKLDRGSAVTPPAKASNKENSVLPLRRCPPVRRGLVLTNNDELFGSKLTHEAELYTTNQQCSAHRDESLTPNITDLNDNTIPQPCSLPIVSCSRNISPAYSPNSALVRDLRLEANKGQGLKRLSPIVNRSPRRIGPKKRWLREVMREAGHSSIVQRQLWSRSGSNSDCQTEPCDLTICDQLQPLDLSHR